MYPSTLGVANASVAVPAGGATVNVIAAPGVNQSLRIVALNVSINRHVTGIVDASIVDPGFGTILLRAMGLSVNGQTTVTLVLPEPGYQVNVNSPLQLSITGTAAAGTATAVAYYFLDSMA